MTDIQKWFIRWVLQEDYRVKNDWYVNAQPYSLMDYVIEFACFQLAQGEEMPDEFDVQKWIVENFSPYAILRMKELGDTDLGEAIAELKKAILHPPKATIHFQ